MPRGDRTGPMGHGPRTGRGAGYCSGYDVPGYANPITGRGGGWWHGFRRGGGRGFRHGYYATGVPGWARYSVPAWQAAGPYPAPAPDEGTALREQAEYLTEALEEVRARLAELEAGSEDGA
jgi:hypothetical protein